MINKVILIGNLGNDPEIRHLESGANLARFSVATNENYLDKNQQWQTVTEWHNIIAWRNLAERAEKSLKKGMQVFIEGKLTHRKWQDNDGKDRYTTEIVANTFRILEKRERSEGDSFTSNFPSEEPPGISNPPQDSSNSSNSSSDKKIDDLPF